ncbi:MAG TPA: SEC59/DGK1/VTE5 family protein [Bacteroidota bacterium]|nr:SEC59/DGK1/VTE5 family protein [Bacteroidota bacterium]
MTQPWEGNRLTSTSPAASSKAPEALHTSATIDYKSEIIRKGIHLCSLSIPIIYAFITKEQALTLLVPVTVAFLVVDLARYYHPPTAQWFYRWFGWLLRRHEQNAERKRLNGATNVLLSACLCVFIFPKIVTINAFAVLIISDSTSALVGRRFGKRPFFNKSLEGAIAFFLSALLVILVAPKVQGLPMEYIVAAIAAIVATIAESLSTEIDDNLSVPLSFGSVMWGLYLWLLPNVDLSSVM